MIGKKCWVPEFPADDSLSSYDKYQLAFNKDFGLTAWDYADIVRLKTAVQTVLHCREYKAVKLALEIFADENSRLSKKQIRAIVNHFKRRHPEYITTEVTPIYVQEED